MKPEDIPQELIDILDERAGKVHNRSGQVISTLAEILTRYDALGAETGKAPCRDDDDGISW